MREQQHYRPYEAFWGTRAQSSMLVPPAGTVSRTQYTLGSAVATGVQDGKEVSTIPATESPELVAKGGELFHIYCAVCHGDAGNGRSVVGANMRPTQPPSLLTPMARAHSPGHLFTIISNGLAYMPAYDWALPPEDRWAVITYLRTLQGQ